MSAPNSINAGMAVTTFDNPMGIDAFEFVEFAAPAGQAAYMHEYLRRMGFTATMRHRTRAITLFRQGGVTFLLNEEPDSFASDYAAAHGPSACGFAIGFTKPVMLSGAHSLSQDSTIRALSSRQRAAFMSGQRGNVG